MYMHNDTHLADQVRRAIALHIKDMSCVSVSAEGGLVTLSGEVANEGERQRAITAALEVPGVKEVTNRLLLDSKDGQTVGEYFDDAMITAAVKGKLLAEPGIKSLSISVETTDGVVVLTGDVHMTEHLYRAEQVAKMANGVKRVDNRLVYKP